MDDHIASALTMFVGYWPEQFVKTWLAERWLTWMKQAQSGTAPPWFDLYWRSLIPLEYLPAELVEEERAWRAAETEQARMSIGRLVEQGSSKMTRSSGNAVAPLDP